MTPAAYHQIVEEGQNTEAFHRFASRMVIAAMALLAPGLCGDVFVVAAHITGGLPAGAVCGGGLLVLFYGLWFVYPLIRRQMEQTKAGDGPRAARDSAVA